MKIDITITKNGVASTYERDIPESWDAVTFRQFMDIAKIKNNTIAILAYFTGIDEEIIRTAEIHNDEAVIIALSFHNQDIQYALPSKIMGYAIPENIEYRSIGQYEDLRGILEGVDPKSPNDTLKLYPLIVATYTCAEAYVRPYDYKDAEKLAPYFLDAPAPEVLAVGNFTLMKLTASRMGKRIPFPHRDIPPKKLRPGWTKWRSRLSSIIRYFGWRAQQSLTARS